MKYNYIAIAGNIGAGKTSLAKLLADKFNGKLILENFEGNEFLSKFYKNPVKYAFPLELSFLASRYQQMKENLAEQDLFKSFTISDYFFDKSIIFARKTLPEDEFRLFTRLFRIIHASLPKPDLLIFLHLPVADLLINIKKRGRDFETGIDADYLSNIQQSYLDYFKQLPEIRILLLNTGSIDFVNNNEDLNRIYPLIQQDYPHGIHMLTP